eukprot:COSAG01_NODE_6513_length_3626_cov_5.634534_5_plen_92_part_00
MLRRTQGFYQSSVRRGNQVQWGALAGGTVEPEAVHTPEHWKPMVQTRARLLVALVHATEVAFGIGVQAWQPFAPGGEFARPVFGSKLNWSE